MDVFITVLILAVIIIVLGINLRKSKNVNKGKGATTNNPTAKIPQNYQVKPPSPVFTDTNHVRRTIQEDFISGSIWDDDISAYNPDENFRGRQPIDIVIPDPLSFYNPTDPEEPVLSTRFINSGEKDNFKYHSLLTYFPENKYKNPPLYVINDRKTVYGFKDGMNWMKVADNIHNALINEYPIKHKNWNASNVAFVIIPSSTKQKTALRYASLCERISTRLGISNGYKAISVKTDRAPLKGKTGIDKTINLNYDKLLLENKYVFLFDDIKTSGESFIQNANRIKALGAKDVRGIFLGETYDSIKYGEPSWAVTRAKILSTQNDKLLDLPF